MKLLVDEVIGSNGLDDYMGTDFLPMVVCVPREGVSDSQQSFLNEYYEKVVDKKGLVSYYCNIINPWKCRNCNYESIVEDSGKEYEIRNFKLKKLDAVGGKYVVVMKCDEGQTMDAVKLVKKVRLKVERKKKQLNNAKSR